MKEEQIRKVFEEVGGNEISNEKVDEFVVAMQETIKTSEENLDNKKLEKELREKLDYEKDWKERLKIMARIISLGLE